MTIKITQRQASLTIMITAIALLTWYVGKAVLSPAFPAQSPQALISAFALYIISLAYWRGWEPARYLFVLMTSLLLGFGLPPQYFMTSISQAVLIPPIIALVVAGPRSVMLSALLVWVMLAQRAGWQGALIQQGWMVGIVCVIGLVVSRLITDATLHSAQKNTQAAKTREEALGVSENRYRTLAANLPNSFVILFDHHLRFILVDGPEVSKAGYSKEAMVGKTLPEALPEPFASRIEPNMRAVLKGEQSSAELSFGNEFYQYNYVSLPDENGEIVFAMILGENITARKQALGALKASEESARTFQQYLQVLYDINIELSKAQTFDDLCRQAVEFGRNKLGFDRLSLWFLDNDPAYKRGSFGTDEQGQTRDERDQCILFNMDFVPPLNMSMSAENLLVVNEDYPLFNGSGEIVGRGWNAVMFLQNAGQMIGYISADNLLTHQPIMPYQRELLILYGTALGQLCTRKRAEEALLESERVEREFQEKLRALHELNLELSTTPNLDEFFSRAVQLGVKKLGFERVSLWLLDDHQTLHGTYSYDETDRLGDEHSVSCWLADDSRDIQLIKDGARARLWTNIPLKTAGRIVGSGWDALAVLWDGTRALGLISIDNFLTRQPPHPHIVDLMGLYGNVVGNLLTQKRVEESLRESEEKFRTIFESAAVGILIQTSGGIVTTANPALLRFIGYSLDQIQGQNLFDRAKFGIFRDPDLENKFDEEIAKTERLAAQEITLYHADGTPRTVLISSDFFHLSGIRHSLTVVIDITDRKRAELELRRSEEQYRGAITAAGLVPYTIDYRLNGFTFFGEDILKLTGYSATQITPSLLKSLVREEYIWNVPLTQSPSEGRRLILSGVSMEWHHDFRIETQMGESRWINDTSVPIVDERGKAIGAIGIMQDITERKQTEAEIRALNTELERRVAARTAQLESANKELEAFTYSVSHDLRAPLRAISGFSRTVMQDYFADLPEKAQHYLSRIQANTLRMNTLIDDLLALSRLGRKEMALEIVNMNRLVEQAIHELTSRGEIGTAQFVVGELPSCYADRSLLEQVFVNLISNAVKYSSKVEQPRIEIDFITKNNGTEYYVKDNGAGFDMQYADKLFGIFQRLHSESDFEGTGIGLATVKRIITRHGGRVWAESKVGQGATFYLTVAKETILDAGLELEKEIRTEHDAEQPEERDSANLDG